MAAPFIRPYDHNRDWNNGLHIFLTTLDPSVNFEPARTIGSYLWYKSYVTLAPHTCFVLDSGTGRAVGYIIGTPDTCAFAQRWTTTFTPIIDPKLVPHPSSTQTNDALMQRADVLGLRRAVYAGECSMLQGAAPPSLLHLYPAHFHIDILPEYQGKGWGGAMLAMWLQCVKGLGAEGVHLGMVRGNAGARRFYERSGFRLCGEVLDGGVSGETGRQGDAVCLMRSI